MDRGVDGGGRGRRAPPNLVTDESTRDAAHDTSDGPTPWICERRRRQLSRDDAVVEQRFPCLSSHIGCGRSVDETPRGFFMRARGFSCSCVDFSCGHIVVLSWGWGSPQCQCCLSVAKDSVANAREEQDNAGQRTSATTTWRREGGKHVICVTTADMSGWQNWGLSTTAA